MRLPSNGNFWPAGSIILPENGQLAVYSMTARDEILLNIPDALMNGQAVVDIIQNCIPCIKNAWMAPSIDLDAILVSIRIATYGEMMKTPVTFKNDIEMEYEVDLRYVLDNLINNVKWVDAVPISNELTVFVRPLNYRQATEVSLQSFETQKIINLSNDDTISEDDKVRMFKESFIKLTDSTMSTIINSVVRVDSLQGSTDNPEFIKEFINNIDKDLFKKIYDHLEQLKNNNSIKPVVVAVTDEMRANGVTSDTLEIPLVFDPSTFFA